MSTSKPSIADSIFQDEEQDTFRDHIGTVDSAGKRVWIYPKKPEGSFTRWRDIVSYILLIALFTMPFIRIDGEPLFLLNILERRFILFGQLFTPQDFHLFVFAMITMIVFIILFTVVFGRIFCGWICPQTIFMENVFRKIEYWIDTSSARAIRSAVASSIVTEEVTASGSMSTSGKVPGSTSTSPRRSSGTSSWVPVPELAPSVNTAPPRTSNAPAPITRPLRVRSAGRPSPSKRRSIHLTNTHMITSPARIPTLVPNSPDWVEMISAPTAATEAPKTTWADRFRGAVLGSVIMKKRNTSTSGEVTSNHQ